MIRHLPHTLDAGRLQLGMRVEAGGVGQEAALDRARDERAALLPELQGERPLLLRQRVDLRRLAIEEVGDGALLLNRDQRERQSAENLKIQASLCSPPARLGDRIRRPSTGNGGHAVVPTPHSGVRVRFAVILMPSHVEKSATSQRPACRRADR